jgi:hypothetical protein
MRRQRTFEDWEKLMRFIEDLYLNITIRVSFIGTNEAPKWVVRWSFEREV